MYIYVTSMVPSVIYVFGKNKEPRKNKLQIQKGLDSLRDRKKAKKNP